MPSPGFHRIFTSNVADHVGADAPVVVSHVLDQVAFVPILSCGLFWVALCARVRARVFCLFICLPVSMRCAALRRGAQPGAEAASLP